MKKYLFYLAVIGWIVGLVVHLLAVAGVDVTAKVPFVWVLHIGIFVVWLPAILTLKNSRAAQEFQKTGTLNTMNPVAILKMMFHNTPTWLTVIAIAGLLYAPINFMVFMASQTGVPDIQNGQYIVHNHGQLIKKLTEQEYHYYRANQLRGFSGHWLAFYGMAAAILSPFGKQKNTEKVHGKQPSQP